MEKLKQLWFDFLESDRNDTWWKRKKELCSKRDVEIIQIKGKGNIFRRTKYDHKEEVHYLMHLSFLMKQGKHFYLEEKVSPYRFLLDGDTISKHQEIPAQYLTDKKLGTIEPDTKRTGERFDYNRMAAVRYAERWWNSYNPEFRQFDVDCTNYISQCLYAGGAPMRGAPNRNQGWWYQGDNWSFSWAVAHSLRWYLSGSTQGLKGREMNSPEELTLGDVICYDFEGDGRWDHTTIVVAKDAYGMPLVNAHTDNSRHRYWSYEDSTAWTENIQYKYFKIGE
ncbi:amidase domain-containing protein [Ornithinibacillus halophilus]|uniref:Putative amidase domain-containing protein n=1 Tax=Ornithinibacillus halophilus TaxID=930117 RepID=A0A1M5HWH7_9BACI|nr:amidase domain-containing protein [Ornithinibacillus halophilus]SHG20243.1 Putative amidase domain-containing protein [Ornithinibacillus halophilus]